MGWVDFPRLRGASSLLMNTLAESIETELGSSLNPSETPADLRYFKNSEGNAEGSVTIRSGREGSNIDFVLGSWLSFVLPFASLHISTFLAMLRPQTDAPHLLCEYIQEGPESLILVFDLLPRNDLVLEPQYLQRFYEDTHLEKIRKEIDDAPESQPYVSSSLYVRSLTSPTALLFKVKGGGEGREMERVISEVLHPAVMKCFGIWVESERRIGRQMVSAEERAMVGRRDEEMRRRGVEADMNAYMPSMFGQDIADRVIEALRRRK